MPARTRRVKFGNFAQPPHARAQHGAAVPIGAAPADPLSKASGPDGDVPNGDRQSGPHPQGELPSDELPSDEMPSDEMLREAMDAMDALREATQDGPRNRTPAAPAPAEAAAAQVPAARIERRRRLQAKLRAFVEQERGA